MGAQWKQAGREASAHKKGQMVVKLVREIMVAAKLGGADPDLNARLYVAVEKAKKSSVTKDTIERAIKKGAGIGDDKLVLDHAVFEGYAPHKVPVIVEIYTDNEFLESHATVAFSESNQGMGLCFGVMQPYFAAILHAWLAQAESHYTH